jgi:hypothetical protein
MNRGTICRDERLSSFDGTFQGRINMTAFPMISGYFAVLQRARAAKSLLAAAAIAALALPGAAEAARYRIVGSYDGIWTTTFATTRGTCSSGLSVPFTVSGGRVSSAGGGRVSGSVSRSGSVAVAVSIGASHASGGGRLIGNFGSGHWSGIIQGDRCAGIWQASRG